MSLPKPACNFERAADNYNFYNPPFNSPLYTRGGLGRAHLLHKGGLSAIKAPLCKGSWLNRKVQTEGLFVIAKAGL